MIRFVMVDGTVETHPQKMDPSIVAPEGPDPCALDAWCARDPEGNPLGATVAFGCHATCMCRSNNRWSSDYPGQVPLPGSRASNTPL